jgi:hypothetical protein
MLFNNQGLVRTEFRAGLALVRVVESSVTALVYYQLGLFIVESQSILLVLIPSVLVGIPLGAYFIRHLEPETFRRICMSFDAWVVGFGFSRVLIELKLMQSPWAYSIMAVTILIDIYLLYVFFRRKTGGLGAIVKAMGAPLTPRDPRGSHDLIRRGSTLPPRDPFGPIGTLLGYVIAILGVAILWHAVRPLP